MKCQNEEITFDQPHEKLFDNRGLIGENHAVGGFTSAIMCSVINSEADRKGHKWASNLPSTQHIQRCPGNSCNKADDCFSPLWLYGLWCDQNSKTCQLDAKLGERCRDNWQCRTGFCKSNECVPAREMGRCPRNSDCPEGTDCRPFREKQFRGPARIESCCARKDDPHSNPCSRHKDCAYHFACSFKYQGEWYCEWDPYGGCGRSGTDCISGSQCCSGKCNLAQGGCIGDGKVMLDSQQPLGL